MDLNLHYVSCPISSALSCSYSYSYIDFPMVIMIHCMCIEINQQHDDGTFYSSPQPTFMMDDCNA